MLAVRNLSEGRCDVAVAGRGHGHWSADQFAPGGNIASSTANGWEPGSPWEAQAWILRQVTDARSEVAEAYQNLRNYIPDHSELDRHREQAAATNDQLIRVAAQ